MDLSDPTRSVVATLDGAVLSVLAAAGKPLTVGQVAAQAARGSEIGIRRSMSRLVEQGIVRATLMRRNTVHELNRDHIAAPIAQMLADLRPLLWQRFREELGSWQVPPSYACVFGSAARGDGGANSDIDLLLVRPPFHPGEELPAGYEQLWEEQVDRLRERAQAWTGNPLQVVDLSGQQWRRASVTHRALLAEVERDGVELIKAQHLSLRSRSKARR
jgi:predicted nucleotidyltransferase